MTHIREKLRFVSNINGIKAAELAEVDNSIVNTRAFVSDRKKERDNTRFDNKELKLKQGFTTSRMLIADYESRKETLDAVRLAISEYKEQYSILLEQMRQDSNQNVSLKSFKKMFKPLDLTSI